MQPPRLTSPESDVLTDSGDSLLAGSESPAPTTDKKSALPRTAPQGFPPENTDPAQVRDANRTQAATEVATATFTVYRFYDEDGWLLYVGQTYRVENRLSQHRKEKPWWPRVARIELDHFKTWREMDDAEADMIHTLGPLYNVQRSSGRVVKPDTVSLTAICDEHKVDAKRVFQWIGGGCPVEMLYGEPRFRAADVRRWFRDVERNDLSTKRFLRRMHEAARNDSPPDLEAA